MPINEKATIFVDRRPNSKTITTSDQMLQVVLQIKN